MNGGFNTFLIGVTVVFITLVLLIIFIKLTSKAVSKIDSTINNRDSEKTKQSEKQAIQSTEENVPTVAALDVDENSVNDELELVAVITAAIAASLGTTSDRLQVRSLRKVERRVR